MSEVIANLIGSESNSLWPLVIEYLIRIGIVIVGFFVFKIIIKLIAKAMSRKLEKEQIKNTFHSFMQNYLDMKILWC